MSNKLRYTRSARGYTVWAADGITRLGEVRKLARPGRTDVWTAWPGGMLDGHSYSRAAAGDRLRAEHERRWGPLS